MNYRRRVEINGMGAYAAGRKSEYLKIADLLACGMTAAPHFTA
jgi:hypothetical protein